MPKIKGARENDRDWEAIITYVYVCEYIYTHMYIYISIFNFFLYI